MYMYENGDYLLIKGGLMNQTVENKTIITPIIERIGLFNFYQKTLVLWNTAFDEIHQQCSIIKLANKHFEQLNIWIYTRGI